jgi:poly(3-hydroxybutyrate) depolymerase
MLYHAFEMQKSWLAGASALATAGAQVIQHPANPLGYFGGSPMFASALEVFAHAALSLKYDNPTLPKRSKPASLSAN